MKPSLYGLVILVLLRMSQASAQLNLQTDVVELQNRIESQINRNMGSLLSTQLPITSFEVATRVKVVEVPPANPKPDKKKELDEMPAGMDLGSVDVRELIESYKQQIEEMKAFKETAQVNKPEAKFAISRLEVILGLDSRYDEAYIRQFREWFTKRVKLDYGATAVATVNAMKDAPKKPEEKIPDAAKEPQKRGPFDDLTFLAYLILATGLVAASWFLSVGLRKLGEGSKKLLVEHTNAVTPEQQQRQRERGTRRRDDEDDPEMIPILIDSQSTVRPAPLVDELLGKISLLCMELGSRVNELVQVWLSNGTEGYLKAAVLIDSIVSVREKMRGESLIAALRILLDADLAISYEVNIVEAYRQASQMSKDVRAEFLAKIYWDLLSIRTLGLESMRRPFDYMQAMNDVDYAELLNSQDNQTKALALMFSDANRTKIFLEKVDDSGKEQIIHSMLNISQISKKQIRSMDGFLKEKFSQHNQNAEGNLVNLFPRTVDILNSITAVDEIRVLRNVVQALPDRGLALKQQYVTLAFVDEWHMEYVSKLVRIATISELAQLIHMVPEVQENVISVCSDRMRTMLQDDLRLRVPEIGILEKNMQLLRSKWRTFCLSENISMGKVISFKKKDDLKHAG